MPDVLKLKVSDINIINDKLAKQDGKVVPEESVNLHGLRGDQADLPEYDRRDDFSFVFRFEPLKDGPAEKKCLSEEPYSENK